MNEVQGRAGLGLARQGASEARIVDRRGMSRRVTAGRCKCMARIVERRGLAWHGTA
jgi:hypothetical protein